MRTPTETQGREIWEMKNDRLKDVGGWRDGLSYCSAPWFRARLRRLDSCLRCATLTHSPYLTVAFFGPQSVLAFYVPLDVAFL